MAPDDRVGAWCIHDVDLAEYISRVGAFQQVRLPQLLGDLRSVPKDVDAIGGGSDSLGQYSLTQERVDEAGFARIELAGHDQEKQTAQLLPCLLKPAQIVSRDIGTKALERGGQSLQKLLLANPELLLPFRQDPLSSQQLPNHRALHRVVLPSISGTMVQRRRAAGKALRRPGWFSASQP
jgi:hypothetical protein